MKTSISVADCVIIVLILIIGAIQFTYYPHAADFVTDPGYPDMARSILEHGSYQFDYLPETTLPPGFPLILAVAGRMFGLSPAVLFRVIAVSTTLGLIVAYQLLRSIEGRGVASAACLLLGSSPSLFVFNTGVIFPEMPYFFVSMLVLLITFKIDHTNSDRTPTVWLFVLSGALVLAVLIRSVGIALLIGLGTWIVASLLAAPATGRRRLAKFIVPLVLGTAAQVGWSTWAQRHEVLEWQLPGYPQSYLSQLRVKNGQYPELGLAHLVDIPSRVGRNIVTRTAGLGQLLTRRYVSPFWSSPAILGVLVLIVVGLALSFRNGGQLYDWYFLWQESIFLFWPWDYRDRFLYPVVPLACLYIWRGAKALMDYSLRRPKRMGRFCLLCGTLMSLSSAAFALRILDFSSNPNHARGDHLQLIAATVFWAMLVVIGIWLLKPLSVFNWLDGGKLLEFLRRVPASEIALPLRIAGIVLLAALVGSGLAQQLARGRSNVNLDITQYSTYPEIAAAAWIRINEPVDRVIMARDQDTVFHYTGRRVVWFPPISDPAVLMNGIRRHNVEIIVVAHHSDSYWWPPEDVCFDSLVQTYGGVFREVNQGRGYQVFEVAPR